MPTKEELYAEYEKKLELYDSMARELVSLQTKLDEKIKEAIKVRIELFEIIQILEKSGEKTEIFFDKNDSKPTT